MDDSRVRRPGRRWCRAATACVAVVLAATTSIPAVSAEPADLEAAGPGALTSVAAQIGADQAWARGITGAGVNVAVIDTGVAPVPALSGPDKVIAMVDLSGEADAPEAEYLDTYGHGTHMAGIIAGRDPGARPGAGGGFLGVAPDAGIVSVKVADNTGATDVSQVIAGIDWVIEHAAELDIRVLNLSYGTDSTQRYAIDPLAHAVERAWQAGIVVVVAAGNDGRGVRRLAMPAADPYVLAVAPAEVRADGSVRVPSWATSGSHDRHPDLAAPGTSIISLRSPGSRIDTEHPGARVGDTLFKGSGSSQAAAVVSGAVALVLDARPELRPDEVKALLRRGADPFHNRQARFQGAGLLDVAAALDAAVPADAVQSWPPSDGSGSLQASRGSHVVSVDGVPVLGEVAVNGAQWGPWDGARWDRGSWDGASWRGVSWRGVSWRGATWTGASWRGASWRGVSWRSAAWVDDTWTGAGWTGASWSGASWREASWSGGSWTGASWRGASWRSGAWGGVSWR
jgi:serine protease AprX